MKSFTKIPVLSFGILLLLASGINLTKVDKHAFNNKTYSKSKSHLKKTRIAVGGSSTYTVNSTDDVVDSFGCDNMHCSLREAIIEANADSACSTIEFNIQGTMQHIISPLSSLPLLMDTTIIDATTQMGNFPTSGRIVLDGTNAGAGSNGLFISTSHTRVYGLQIQNFSNAGIQIGNGLNTITNTTIGAINKGNIIISNSADGIVAWVDTFTMQANYIGTDTSFVAGLGNFKGVHIVNSTGSDITIGGRKVGEGNYICSNDSSGIICRSPALIANNRIGTDITGTIDLGNNDAGIELFATSNSVIGGGKKNSNAIAFNRHGILLQFDADNNFISHNSIYNNDTGIELFGIGANLPDSNTFESNLVYCNSRGIVLGSGTNGMKAEPDSLKHGTHIVRGTAEPFDIIEVFLYNHTSCATNDSCQGETSLGFAHADVDGDWEFVSSDSLKSDTIQGEIYISATATDADNGNTSKFACIRYRDFPKNIEKRVIIEFPLNWTPSRVREEERMFESMGFVKQDSCNCINSTPRLQLWRVNNLIDLYDVRQPSQSMSTVDTSVFELNYKQELNPIESEPSETITECILVANPAIEATKSSLIFLFDSGFNGPIEADPARGIASFIPGHSALAGLTHINSFEVVGMNNDGDCYEGNVFGYDFVNENPNAADFLGHGTHVAGIMSSDYPGDIALKIVNQKVYDHEIGGTLFDLICAIHNACNMLERVGQATGKVPKAVFNLSLGYSAVDTSWIFWRALKRAEDLGVIAVLSAGNDTTDLNIRQDTIRWPSGFKRLFETIGGIQVDQSLSNLISVAALNASATDINTTFSNTGSDFVDVAAPGTGIRSTHLNNSFDTLSGTSMAAPFVSRLVSIIQAYKPNAMTAQILDCIRLSVDPIISSGLVAWDGQINVAATLECMEITVLPEPPPPPPDVSMLPTMFRDKLVIDLGTANYRDVRLEVYTQQGQKVYNQICDANRIEWNGTGLNGQELIPGIYLVSVKLDNQRYSEMILKL